MPRSARLLYEAPPNPHLCNYHTSQQLTTAMAEKHLVAHAAASPTWITALLALDGLTEVHLLRHHLRLRKAREASWDELRAPIEAIVVERLTSADTRPTWIEEEASPRKREFPLPGAFASAEIQAFEGVDVAQDHPLAKALFALPGVILVTIHKDRLQLKRGGAYRWDALAPQVVDVLQQFSTPGSLPGIQAEE